MRASGSGRSPSRPGHTTGVDDLTAALRAWARGDVATASAVELLAGQVGWLVRPDFVRDVVEVADGFAWVDWAGAGAAVDAGRLSCSSGEGTLLRVAASIAAGVPVDLRALVGLDRRGLGLVARAVLAAGGDAAGAGSW